MADNTVKRPATKIAWQLGNLAPDVTASGIGTYRTSNFRCDSTMKTSSGKYQQGCVVPGITPEFELTGSTPEQTWHVQEAIGSVYPAPQGARCGAWPTR